MGFFTTTEEITNVSNDKSTDKSSDVFTQDSKSYELYYEDIMDVIENPNSTVLRNLLTSLVHMYKFVIIKGLNSNNRHKIYNQCYYPLKFEKIIEKENVEELETKNKEEYTYTNILIFNYKIKNNNENEFIKTENENKDTERNTDTLSDSDSETEQSFITTEESQLEKLENLSSQQLEIMSRTEIKINKCINKLNFVLLLNAIGWLLLFIVDPIRVDIVQKMECY